jgi:hypothetical protein
MIPPFLGGELAAFLDEVAELRLTSFELAGFVVGRDPVSDLAGLWLLLAVSYPSVESRIYHFWGIG